MFGVETHSFLPNNQSDGRDLARQREARQRWLHPSGYQTGVEFLERSSDGSGPGRGTLEDIFQIVIVVGVEPSNSQEFLGAFQPALHDSVFAAGRGLQCQTTVDPQLSLGARTMWRLQQRNEQSLPYRRVRDGLAQHFHRAVFSAFRQQIASYLLAKRPQGVQLLVVDLRPAMHAGFCDLAEPLRA